MAPKLSHARLWAAIDALAQRHGLSVSGLARAAGLDPTAFNKSKRITAEGRPRWPGTDSFDDAGFPVGGGWEEVAFPDLADEHAYALEIAGDSMAPVYRDGDIIIVSPAASIRRGDRVVVKTVTGEVTAKVLARRTVRSVELHSLNPAYEARLLRSEDILWMARIIWASQ